MSKVVGDIAVQVGADVAPLQRGMRQASGSIKDFDRDTAKMARNMVKVGAAVVTAAASIAGGVLAAANQAAKFGNEINNLARLSGTGTTEFQRLAAAAKTVGLENEKLADIFKDVNDKIGDFNQTGGGPLADFFENIAPLVGVTADEFARLSGPEALQLYVSSLERAGASQQQMTFYMEAIASDATALLPLLRDNGRAFSALGDEAEAAGRVLSEDAVAGAVELERELQALTDALKVSATAAVLEHKDELIALASFVTETALPALIGLGEWFLGFAGNVASATEGLAEFSRRASEALGFGEDTGTGATSDPADVADANAMGRGDPSSTGQFYVDENGNVQEYGAAPEVPGITAPALPPAPPPVLGQGAAARDKERGGAGKTRDFEEEMEKLQEQFATESEIVQAEYERQQQQLAEFRAAKVATEEEYNILEERMQEAHAEKMAAIERATQQARLQAVSGALGDLSALMFSENKKLFKIGQAAAIAESVVSGYQAAVAAWQKGMSIGGPPVAAAFTAASLAKTGALISQIKSASSSGGSSGGGGGGGSVGDTSSTSPRQAVDIRLLGDDLMIGLGGQILDQLIPQLNERIADGAILRLAR